jgi:hypothetical protein
MFKLILNLYLLVCCCTVYAKDVYIYVGMDSLEPRRLQYTVDPKLQVSNLAIFLQEGRIFDPANFVLARKTDDGYVSLNKNNRFSIYGDTIESPMRIFIIPKSEAIQKENEFNFERKQCPNRIGALFCDHSAERL